MRKLTHGSPDNAVSERRLNRLAPMLVSAVALGVSLGVPAKSGAEQPAAQRCSASVERGSISSYTSTNARSRLLRTPLLENGRYLQITLPNAYMGQVSQAASARPESERQSFVTLIMQNNVSAALSALGTSRSATFACAPATSTTAAPVTAPQPTQATPAPTAPAPTTTSPPAQPAPAPTQDGGTEQPGQRRRVIQPGTVPAPVPSGKADAPKQDAQAVAAPIPPVRRGGKGTDKEPFVIEVPVTSKAAAGTVLYSEKFSYTFSGTGGSEKLYISLRFVPAGGTKVTSKSQLVGAIAPVAASLMNAALAEKGSGSTASTSNLSSSIGVIVNHARNGNADVGAYAPGS